jgi:phospholipid/cholesterol/gamma-HCH transport system ATP-binding protein
MFSMGVNRPTISIVGFFMRLLLSTSIHTYLYGNSIAMIQLENIKKSFADKTILHNITATMEPGKCNLIIGSSGSGKTVLTKCMVGLFTPDAGEITYEDKKMSEMTDDDRKLLRQQIGIMTVEQNVLFPLDMFTKLSQSEKKKRVNEVLERVNLQNAHKKFPAEISGGMKKRVGIARAIVLNPKYLFCDEPNSGLDPQTSLLIDKLIQEITREFNTTTIVVTHDMNSVMEIGDHIVYMHQGHKEWEGSNKEIIFSKNELLNSFIFASEFLQDAKQMRMIEAKQ